MNRSIALVFVLAVLSSPATAQPYLEVDFVNLDADGIVAVPQAFLFMVPCSNVDGECERTRVVTVQVSPCPPGLECVGGIHEFSWDADNEPAPSLVLSPDTTYDFSASYAITSYGLDQANRCRVVLCEGSGPMDGTTVTTPSLTDSYWSAQVVGSQDGLAQVEFTPTANEIQLCGPYCYWGFYELRISPCPPGVQCMEGEYVRESIDYTFGDVPPDPILVGLDPAVPYQVSGRLSAVFLDFSQFSDCDQQVCGYLDVFTPVEILTAVPNDPTSWGALKIRY